MSGGRLESGHGAGGGRFHPEMSFSDRGGDAGTLAAPASRLIVLASGPFLLTLLYYLSRARRFDLLMVGLLVLAAAVASAVLRVGTRVRTWVLATALCGGGLLDLLGRGWTGSTALFFWLAVWIAGLFGQLMCARAALGVGAVAFLGLHAWPVVRSPVMAGDPVSDLQLWGLLIDGLTFVFVGGASLRIARAFSDRLDRVSSGAAREIELLTESCRALRRNIGGLQRDQGALQARVERLESLVALVKNLVPLMADVRALLNRVPEFIAQHLGAAEVYLYLLDEATTDMVLRGAATVEGKTAALRGARVRLDDDHLVARAANSGEILLAGGVDEMGEREVSAALPLVDPVRQSLLGVLLIGGMRQHKWDDSSGLTVLNDTAEFIAMGLGFAQRISDEIASLESASPVYRALRDLVTSQTEEQVYRTMVETAQWFGADRVLVARMDNGVESLQVVEDMLCGEQALHVQTPSPVIDSVLLDLMSIGVGLPAPLWVEDLAGGELELGAELVGVLSELTLLGMARAVALIPLRAGTGPVIGHIVLLYRNPHRFGEQERQIYRVFGDFGAVIIERLRLLSATEQHLAQTQARLAVGMQLRNVSEPEEILKIAVRELGQVLQADLAAIELRPAEPDRESPGETDDGMA